MCPFHTSSENVSKVENVSRIEVPKEESKEKEKERVAPKRGQKRGQNGSGEGREGKKAVDHRRENKISLPPHSHPGREREGIT